MESKFQTSFIPKSPIVASAGSPVRAKQPINLISLICMVIFAAALLATGGLFAYQYYIKGNITRMEGELESARTSFETELLNEFTRLDLRISTAQQLLASHKALSLWFETLQNSTARSIQFSDFSYQMASSGTLEVFMKGVADSYNSVALQARLFEQNQNIQNPTFMDLDLDEEGNVVFSFKADIDPALMSYENTLSELSLTFDGDE